MTVSWRETWQMALGNLRSNRLRSLLTILGIVIGNTSVLVLVGLGRGAQRLVDEQLGSLGANVIFVVPGKPGSRQRGAETPRNLTLADAEAIAANVSSARTVVPQISQSKIVQLDSRSVISSVIGTTPEFLHVRQFEVDRGRFISEADVNGNRSVAAIGPDLARKLLPNGSSLGRRIRIGGHSFEVIGLMAPKGSSFGNNQDEAVYIPLSAMVSRISGRDPNYGTSLTFINIEASDPGSVDTAKFQITNLLRQRHRILRDNDFTVRTQKEVMAVVGSITSGLTVMLGAIGGISLLVGGVGIMNIMLVAVSERVEEIGLRKAVGARRGDLQRQFLAEAAMLSTLGGLVGSGIGVGSLALLAATTPLPALTGPGLVLVTVGISGGIGVFFGVIPARRAARLDPIVALRRL